MRRPEFPRFREHDTTLSLWLEEPEDPAIVEVRNRWVRQLRARGFHVQPDRETRERYPALKKHHHEGWKGHLQFKLRLAGRSLELTFFQDLVHTNPNGGQYDFGKRGKMPYLMGKLYELERHKLVELMAAHGYTFIPDIRRRGIDFVEHERAELADFQGQHFYTRKWERYNITSAAGRELTDGDVVYFRDYGGRMLRGIAYRNINNMWWVLLPCGSVHNRAAFELWHREDITRDLRGRQIPVKHAEETLRRRLADAVKAEEFERAALIRDALRARFPAKKAA